MGLDAGFFQALTGPMTAAGDIQSKRDQQQVQQLQLMQQQRQMELNQLQKQNAIQEQLNTNSKNAIADLYTKNNFARDKDVTEFQQWHESNSGWAEIQQALRDGGSIDNARLYHGLDYKLQQYYANIKDNPVSRKVNKNKAALELYHSFYDDKDGNDKLLTRAAKQRYLDWKAGKTDNFIFNGARKDYLNETINARDMSDAIDLEDILYTGENYMDIHSDMILDDPTANENTRYTDQEMLAWLSGELGVSTSGGTTYFDGQAMFGDKEIDTDAASLLKDMIAETNKIGIVKGSDFFANTNLKEGESFNKLFNHPDFNLANTWNRWGGYDPSKQSRHYKGPLVKNRQVATGSRVLVDKGIEDTISEILFGNYQGTETNRYVSEKRKVYGLDMIGTYNDRGRQITSDDTEGFTWPREIPTGMMVGEYEEMDLTLNGYFVALKGTAADGTSILLTDVGNESDRAKMANEYKDVIFKPTLVAELEDSDIGINEVYYKEFDLADTNVLTKLNEKVNPEKLNEVLGQTATYEQKVARDKMVSKRKMVANAKLQRTLNMPDIETTDQLINGYDQSLTVSLGLSQVSATKIQQVVPLIMSDLYVTSQKERTYPYDLTPGETDPSKKMIAQSPGQYMAYSAKILREGLISGNPSFNEMLKAIKTGEYDSYSATIYDEKTRKKSRVLSKQIIQRQRN